MAVSGERAVGGLVGRNWGTINSSSSTCEVAGGLLVGGLIGCHKAGTVAACHSSGSVGGLEDVGGLIGAVGVCDCFCITHAETSDCYSTAAASGESRVGGLIGYYYGGRLVQCYSTGVVDGDVSMGGLIGYGAGPVLSCFWDVRTSGLASSAGGQGKTTAEMLMLDTFLTAGWDFVGETANGVADVWYLSVGQDYPKLWWELAPADL